MPWDEYRRPNSLVVLHMGAETMQLPHTHSLTFTCFGILPDEKVKRQSDEVTMSG